MTIAAFIVQRVLFLFLVKSSPSNFYEIALFFTRIYLMMQDILLFSTI